MTRPSLPILLAQGRPKASSWIVRRSLFFFFVVCGEELDTGAAIAAGASQASSARMAAYLMVLSLFDWDFFSYVMRSIRPQTVPNVCCSRRRERAERVSAGTQL